ncbi:MAG: hypothetical protein ACRDQU_12515 [Pseudonocardiaceae bacterium]
MTEGESELAPTGWRRLFWRPSRQRRQRLSASLYARVLRGDAPAKCLAFVNRDRLIGELRGNGWPDERIADVRKVAGGDER